MKNYLFTGGALDIALFGLEEDWYGEKLEDPSAFGVAMDHGSLWFLATRRKPASIHPQARPGVFTPELWKHDVAEFFKVTQPREDTWSLT